MEQTLMDYYIAGILDGEGYFGIIKQSRSYKGSIHKYYFPAVKVASTDKRICDLLLERFGGYISHRDHNDRQKDSWCWEVKNNKQVLAVIEATKDKLLIKREPCSIVEDLIRYRNARKSKMYIGYSDEEWQFMDNLYAKIRDFNRRGPRPATTK